MSLRKRIALGICIAAIASTLLGPSVWLAVEERRCKRTYARISGLTSALEAYATDHNAYPDVPTAAALKPLLIPTYARTLSTLDGWGRELTYRAVPREGMTVASPGADGTYDAVTLDYLRTPSWAVGWEPVQPASDGPGDIPTLKVGFLQQSAWDRHRTRVRSRLEHGLVDGPGIDAVNTDVSFMYVPDPCECHSNVLRLELMARLLFLLGIPAAVMMIWLFVPRPAAVWAGSLIAAAAYLGGTMAVIDSRRTEARGIARALDAETALLRVEHASQAPYLMQCFEYDRRLTIFEAVERTEHELHNRDVFPGRFLKALGEPLHAGERITAVQILDDCFTATVIADPWRLPQIVAALRSSPQITSVELRGTTIAGTVARLGGHTMLTNAQNLNHENFVEDITH